MVPVNKAICDTGVTVAANVEAFIIPNRIGYVGGVFETKQEWLHKVATLNGIELDNNDRVVELWITSDQCDNMVDSIFVLDAVGGMQARIQSGLFPEKLFEGRTEGDELDVTVPLLTDAGVMAFKMHMTLSQLKYQYKTFGSFEKAFEMFK